MKLFWRVSSGIILAAYLGLIGVQTFHTHTASPTAQAECQVCKIAHQTPALVNPPADAAFTLGVQPAPQAAVPQPYLRLVFQAHGRSPPVL